MRRVSHFSRLPQSGGVQNQENVRTVSQFSALGLRKVTTVSHVSPSWRLVLVDFARGVVRMLVSGSLSLPAKRPRLQRLSPVAAGRREYSLRGVQFSKKKCRQSRILVPWARESVVKYVVPYRRRRKSVAEYVVFYCRRRGSVVKYVVPYRWRRKSVVEYVVPCR